MPSTSVGRSGRHASVDDVLLNEGVVSKPPQNDSTGAFPVSEEDSKLDNRKRPLAEVIDIKLSPKVFAV